MAQTCENGSYNKRYLFVLMGFLFQWSTLFSQNELKNWYFGTGTDGITFVNNIPQKLSNKLSGIGFEGMVVANDPVSGSLLFYSNGQDVVNGNHSIMTNGSGLTGHFSGAQCVQSCPVPGTCGKQFYLFTNSAWDNTSGKISYSVIDFTNDPLGAVINKNTLFWNGPSDQGMCLVNKPNTSDYWLIANEFSTAKYNIWPLTTAGIGTPVTYTFSNTGSSYQMNYDKGSQKLTVTGLGQKLVTLIDFNANTGVLSNEKQLASGFGGSAASRFSPDGTKLYAGLSVIPGAIPQLYQYDFNTSLWTNMNTCCYAHDLKIGPDNKMYFINTYNTSQPISVIEYPNLSTIANACGYHNYTFSSGFNGEVRRFPEFLTLPTPVVANKDIVTVTGIPVNIPVLINDMNTGGGVFDLDAIVLQPKYGSAAINGDQIQYVPVQNVCEKTDTLIYRIKNGDCVIDTSFVIINFPACTSNVSAAFTIPDTVCIGSPLSATNTSVNASTYSWNFCVADLNIPPTGVNLGNVGNRFQVPVSVDYAFFNGNYYGFVVNYAPGGLTRLDFGNSLLNTPTSVSLGNFGGIIPAGSGAHGVQVVYNEGKWYAIIVGGYDPVGSTPRILKLDFGTNLNNPSPIATDWGNIGNMYQPIDLHVFKENNNWYGFTVSAENSTITRFDFTNSFDNIPTGVNLGNIGNLQYPNGIFSINDNGNWRIFVVNGGDRTRTGDNYSISRLDFGASLLNTPVGINLGNPGGMLRFPVDITIMQTCDQTVGFVINGDPRANGLVKLDFNNLLSSIPIATNIGNPGNLNFPHSMSKLFRVNENFYSFITNADNNTLTRLTFTGCNSSSLPSSVLQTPPPITYDQPGRYSINLTVDEGLISQTSFCKQIVVLPAASADFSFTRDICDPHSVLFKNESTGYKYISWDFGNTTTSAIETPAVVFDPFGTYDVKLKVTPELGCADSITKAIPVMLKKDSVIITRDTVLCYNGPFKLNTLNAFEYCWSASPDLSATNIGTPVISGIIPKTTYYVNALMPGKELIVNGDFSQGNTGFASEYLYNASSGYNAGVYTIRANTQPWHPNFSDCSDHTSHAGNMMLLNGSQTAEAKVWSQTISITPNTNYAFSTWLQSLSPSFPAKLQFYINGKLIGNIFNATSQTCNWIQFYSLWNSGASTTASIAIVNQNTEPGGNDFALDDISFSALQMVRDSVTVTINDNPIIDFNYNIPFCKSVQLSGTAIKAPAVIDSWNWNFGDLKTATASTLSHNYLKGGKYTIELIATDMNSCKDTMTKTIQLDTITAVVSPDTMVCKNATITLRGFGGTVYEWSPASLMNNTGTSDPQVTVAETTRFYLKIKNGILCEDTASVLVSVKARPAFVRPDDQAVCADSSVQLKGGNGDLHRYRWAPAATLDDPDVRDPVATPPGTMQYQVTITEEPCHYDTTFYAINVQVNPNPSVTAYKQRDIDCINPTAPLYATGSGAQYRWTPAAGVDYPARAAVLAAVDSTTTFVVKNTNEFNCSAYDSVTVQVTNTAKPVFTMPNAFTPNNDGINDCYGIKHWGNVVIHELSIYNRWGEKVFSTKNPKDCWNGMYKNQLQPPGGYVYIIKAKSFCGEIVRKGTLALIR